MEPVHAVLVSAEQVATFERSGAVKLAGLLDGGTAARLRALLEVELGSAESGVGRDYDAYDKVKYGVDSTAALVRAIVSSGAFQKAIHALIPRRLLYTQSVGFALGPGKGGLDWHFDLVSYAYIDPRSPAYTVWLPLTPIDPRGQRGGMEYVGEDVYSGRDKMVLSARHFHEGPKVIAEVGGLDAYRSLMPCSPAEKVVLDRNRIEHAFAPGDALVFSRYVWHRSCPMHEGPVPRRLALTVRFVAADAIYDRTLCQKFGEFSVAYGNPGVKTSFGLSFDDLRDGDPMIRSRHAVDVF
ncbi:MAG: hypothetical protein U0166_06705 [Acidobacteriota bacterium]